MRITYIFKNKKEFIFYKELLSFTFLIYVLCLFYVVTFQDVGWSSSNFIPFKEMFRYSIGSRLFIKNVLGNIIMFVPYGFFVSYYLDLKKPNAVLVLVILLSLSIETTQLIIGRVFDIDDIILNTLGGLVGFFLYHSLDTVNERLPKILKRPAIYNMIIAAVATLFIMYMLNMIKVGL